MRWNQLADDVPRAKALADVLCGAALSDGGFADEERVVVGAMLMKVLGVSQLPGEVSGHIGAFSPENFDLMSAVARLGLESERDKKALVKVVSDIVAADAVVQDTEKAYLERLASLLGVTAG
jgi:uncharacterized tellurite resistance protein B-like protein